MLIRFNVANFLSFDQETEFNMLAASSLKTHKEHKYTIKKDLEVLKASAIYGANGAGKSNLVKAIHSFQNLVKGGKIPLKVQHKKNKLKKENETLPISHEMEFSVSGKVYTYGLSFDNNIILEEWLFETGGAKSKMIFERKHSFEKKHPIITVTDKYIKTEKSKMLFSLMEENLLKQNELLISKNENLKIKEISDVNIWFKLQLLIIYPDTKSSSLVNNISSNNKFKIFSEELLRSFNVGIDQIGIASEDLDIFLNREDFINKEEQDSLKSELDKGIMYQFHNGQLSVTAIKENEKYIVKRVVTNRIINGNIIPFEVEEESDGTQRLMDFIPMLNSLLQKENTYIIDEIDRSLHPAILHTLIRKIMNDNTTKGQLIFTTHESSLLNCKIFRTDEIWFAEKDKETHTTKLYTLNEFKPRHDLDIEKGYLNGRFGAIPFLTKLEDLNWNE